jgi:ketosteroid isomerase-like protein
VLLLRRCELGEKKERNVAEEIEMISAAKSVIASHEKLAAEGNLSKIVSNFSEDIVMLAANAPLVKGMESFKSFYSDLLAMGKWTFLHHYEGADVVGDSVQLYGVSRGELTVGGGDPEQFSNNFIITVKDIDGKMRIWRAAFASATE